MRQKAFVLQNRGMNRDLSVSKAGESSAFENHNIRIMARDNDTLLSVTNERGNKEVSLGNAIVGTLIGWNVLNEHVILFTHQEDTKIDRIYRIDYKGDGLFEMIAGSKKDIPLYTGKLGFSTEHPIESVVYHETADIQKIYWVDGIHVLRFMNIMAEDSEIASWHQDNTSFDTNRPAQFSVNVEVSKDNAGNSRANGVVQYFLTYFNKHGQETGYVWASDLIYLSPVGVGGAADGMNTNRVLFDITGLDTRYTNFRIYSVFRSSYDGQTVTYLVHEGDTSAHAKVVDDGAHLTVVDTTKILFIGSRAVHPGTLAHKDQTLFLGDLQATVPDYSTLNAAVTGSMFETNGWESSAVEFAYSDDSVENGIIKDIPLQENGGKYSYENQLIYSSSEILTFKGGEKYRFALVFRDANGAASKAFWIGDLVNSLYPVMEETAIKRVVAKCTVPAVVVSAARAAGFETVQLMIAEATYADRSIKAQGILNPTMFNVWERYNDRLYACPSWISRPRNSWFPSKHFSVVENSTNTAGEIQCNYWETAERPTPYFRIQGYGTAQAQYVDEFDGEDGYDHLMVIYGARETGQTVWYANALVVKGTRLMKTREAADELETYFFDFTSGWTGEMIPDSSVAGDTSFSYSLNYTDPNGLFTIEIVGSPNLKGGSDRYDGKEKAYLKVVEFLKESANLPADSDGIISLQEFEENLCGSSSFSWGKDYYYYNPKYPQTVSSTIGTILNNGAASAPADAARWYSVSESLYAEDKYSDAAYYKKHLMFIDENTVTLNSPELEYEAVSFDNAEGYKIRILGVARISDDLSDYTVDASHGKRPGDNLIQTTFSKKSGLISWPLWAEYALREKKNTQDFTIEEDPKKRTSADYEWGSDVVNYWLYMWQHAGIITGYTDDSENQDYSRLRSKIFANLRYSDKTIYLSDSKPSYNLGSSLRIFNALSSQYISLSVGEDTKYYDANARVALSMPGTHKYPIIFSRTAPKTTDDVNSSEAFLYSNVPIQIEFDSQAHAVFSLPTDPEATVAGIDHSVYLQRILPSVRGDGNVNNVSSTETVSGALIPWIDVDTDGTYPFKDYYIQQEDIQIGNQLGNNDSYYLLGEIYYDFDDPTVTDTRYGGTSEAAIESNRFVAAGPEAILSNNVSQLIYGNRGDTYFQRWDCLKTKPIAAEGALNGVIDIASVMLETHINIDGRTDRQRGTKYLASINTAQWGTLNRVYSQSDNYFVRQVLDEDFDLDAYRSSVSWTLQKADSADIDEWTHVTLSTHLKLDGDKGICRAIRRIQNSLIAFQDRGISEILFNSRTQLSTTDGVPVEIANSGKVDGKRYITNKYGCLNKWSIVEGKNALYFVDNINKALCTFSGNGVQNLSTSMGFGVWFRLKNDANPWTPKDFNNFVSFYDRIHSDVYIIKKDTDDEKDPPALVFNETLGAFTSFFDYGSVPMMTNVEDKFISFKQTSLWLQNEGVYCNFFGRQYDFWMQYRVTPEPFGDKVWTNLEYRADFYRVLSGQNSIVPVEPDFTDDLNYYQPNETFNYMRFWNEYQTTADRSKYDCKPIKKFRIWRLSIPRAKKNLLNPHGLDRIRNPWMNLLFRKYYTGANDPTNQDLMQLHDMTVIYFE